MDVVSLGLAKADARRNYAPRQQATRMLTESATPEFARVGDGSPIDTITAGSSITSMYWPCVMRVDDKLDNPLDTFYKWDSTDHDPGPGGVRLKTAPSPLGPWTDRGIVFQDPAGTGQTEEPRVLWNPTGQQLVLFYQNSDTIQWAGRTTSADGVTWAAGAKVLSMTTTSQVQKWPGSGAQGYMSPIVLGDTLMAFHLIGGGNYSVSAQSYSNDWGATWQTDARTLHQWGDLPVTDGYKISPTPIHPFLWRGEPWIAGLLGPYQSGTASALRQIVVAPTSRDWRQIIATPRIIFTPTLPWETPAAGGSVTSFQLWEDRGDLYLFYVIDNKLGCAICPGGSL